MDFTFFLTAMIILVGCLWIYYYFSYNRTTLYGNQVLLNTASPNLSLAPITASPNSLNYTLSLWIFVISWSSDNAFNVVMNMNTGATSLPAAATSTSLMSSTNPLGSLSNYVLYLDRTSPNLYWYVPSQNSVTCKTGSSTALSGDILITNNFPIQSWVFVTISCAGNLGDFYVNGKLVTSKNLCNSQNVYPPGGQIELGKPSGTNGGFNPSNVESNPNMYIANVQRIPNASNPQDVWTSYMAGNGVSSVNVSSYGMEVGLKQNGQVITQYNLN